MRRNGIALLIGLIALAALAPASLAQCAPDGGRTLILALDGVPYRVMLRAREQGAFADWPEPRALIAPFPSLTNLSFTVMLQPIGVEPAGGYEVAYYDVERNGLVGRGLRGYQDRLFAWRDAFDSTGRTVGSKLSVYTHPRKKARKELDRAEEVLYASPRRVVLAHVGSTDALQHIKGDAETIELLSDIDAWIEGVKQRHLETIGHPLRVVLLSDHGNTNTKIRGASGLKRELRRAGLRAVKHLEKPGDVVAVTFGLVSYGALYLDPSLAERAARAVAGHEAVDLAAWRSGLDEVRVVSGDGSARIRWRGEGVARRFAYLPSSGDPLDLRMGAGRMRAAGFMDDEGFASDADWFRLTATATYPDALNRLVESFTVDPVVNRATVLFSLEPGHSWGWKSARASSVLRGGRLEGTHGGLDRGSTLGFFLSEEWHDGSSPAIRARVALEPYLTVKPELYAQCSNRTAIATSGAEP